MQEWKGQEWAVQRQGKTKTPFSVEDKGKEDSGGGNLLECTDEKTAQDLGAPSRP